METVAAAATSAAYIRVNLKFTHAFEHLQLIFVFQRHTDMYTDIHSPYMERSLLCTTRFYFSFAIRSPSLFRAQARNRRRTHTYTINSTQARQPSVRSTDRPTDTDIAIDNDDTCTRAHINIFVDVSQKKCKIKKKPLRTNHILLKWSSNKRYFD